MIGRFEDDYHWLSNFSEEGGIFPTLEHVYQAMKAVHVHEAVWVMAARTPGQAKKAGRKIEMRKDFDSRKNDIMLQLLRVKFSEPEIQAKLLNTGDQELIEGNWWGDKYWGVDIKTGEGENHLGKLLMKVRQEIRDEPHLFQ